MLPPGAPAPLVGGLPPYDGPPPGNITAIFYSQLACTVVLFYEWFITFDIELDRIWTRQKSGFTVYWAFVRYTPLVTRVLDEIGMHKMNWSDQSCARFALTMPIFQSISILLAHACFLLRTYAVYQRRKVVLFPLITLWLAEVALDIWPLVRPGATANRVPGPGCMAQLWTTEIVVAQLSTIIAFDTLVLSLIVGRCLYVIRHNGSAPLIRALIRDGIGYFGIVFVCNVTNLILLFHSHFVIQQSFLMFALAAPSVMVNRMLLSLRAFEPSKHPVDETTHQTLALTSPYSVMDAIIDEFGDDMAREHQSRRTRPRVPTVRFA